MKYSVFQLKCCAVDDNGWVLYQQSFWFTNTQQYSKYAKIYYLLSCSYNIKYMKSLLQIYMNFINLYNIELFQR